jgi:predicted RNase H-like nuclease (RuvC/YqgF family)
MSWKFWKCRECEELEESKYSWRNTALSHKREIEDLDDRVNRQEKIIYGLEADLFINKQISKSKESYIKELQRNIENLKTQITLMGGKNE